MTHGTMWARRRSLYLGVKFMLLSRLAAGTALLLTVSTALSRVLAKGVAATLVGGPSTSWSHTALLLERSSLAIIPCLVVVTFATLLARSSATGMAIGIVDAFGEQIVVASHGGVFSDVVLPATFCLARTPPRFPAWTSGVAVPPFAVRSPLS